VFAIRKCGPALLCALAAAGMATAPAGAHPSPPGTPLAWGPCETAAGWQCATATVPKAYGRPGKGTFQLAVTRLPATDQKNKVGSLFINYGGPGASAVDITQAVGEFLFAGVRERFDLVAFDPRGTGATSQAIDCRVNQEALGPYSQPFFEPGDALLPYLQRVNQYWNRCRALNPDVLPYTSTANYARDMDRLREAVGDSKLTYFGFSYGTFIGATYAALFPHRIRALVLDGAVDPHQYINRPMAALRTQTAAFEKGFGRFMMTCSARKGFCSFGGDDPWLAFDKLVEQADRAPLPVTGADPRPVDGEDVLAAAFGALYSKFAWTDLALALNEADAGDGTRLRALANSFYGRQDDGTYDPLSDRYLALSAEQRYPDGLHPYLESGEESWQAFDHFWWNAGYVELYWRAIPARVRDAFYGPFAVPAWANTPLVIGTRYDPATPYRSAKRAVQRMGNARLLTLNGDGHTAYFNGSECIDRAVVAYLVSLTLPPEGTQCGQEIAFPLPQEAAVVAESTSAESGVVRRYAGPRAAPFELAR
jgi:pimeloyl-ACP methyl ester carboxylesterase